MPRIPLAFPVLALAAASLSAAAVTVDPPQDPDALRTAWRYVGLKPEALSACPQPSPAGGWSVQDMFPGAPNLTLRRFCVYEHSGAPAGPPLVEGLQRLDRDAMAVRAQGGDLDDALWRRMALHFRSQAGDFDPPLTGGVRTRLAIVDTAATRDSGGENHPGTSPHGYTLLNIARRLSCGGLGEADCVAQASSRLALGWECFDREQLPSACRNAVEGGLYGLIGEMAQAIRLEVERWQAAGPGPLVLNLSIGWDPMFGGLETLVSDMPAPVAAVHAAIEDAVCRGAVVVAASGNREGGPTPEVGPIVPAAWEMRAAPSFSACAALGTAPAQGHFPGPGAGNVYRPLVYAVAGVRADDGPVFNSRNTSAALLAAFGDHARVSNLSGAPTAALTGSSGATLLVSLAAAAAAYYRPDLKPYEIMTEVYRGGRPLGRGPDFCVGGSPCPVSSEVRRVTLCESLAYLCRAGGPLCPASLPTCTAAAPLDLSGVDLTTFLSGATTIDGTTLSEPYAPLAACRFETLSYAPAEAPVDPCPHWQYFARSPAKATQPQPGSYPCPNCTYGRGAGLLYVEIDGAYDGELTEATLKCGKSTWSLGGPEPWVAGDKAEISGVTCATNEVMQVSFTVDGTDSATSPVLIEP